MMIKIRMIRIQRLIKIIQNTKRLILVFVHFGYLIKK